MMGFFMQSIDRDDYDNSCKCGDYPVLKSIIAGTTGKSIPANSVIHCKSFAVHK